MATGKFESRMRRNSKSDAASSSHARLQEDAHLGGLMDTATEKLVATKEESGDVAFPNLKLGDRLLIEQLRGNPLQQVNQTTGEVQKLKGQHGHKIYTRLRPQFITRKQSSRSPGKSTDEKRTTLWMVWTWIWLCGAYVWIPLFEQQFILDKTMRRIYDSWKIIFLEQCGTVIQWKWETDLWTKKSLV